MTGADQILEVLAEQLAPRLPGIAVTDAGLEAEQDFRYGRLTVRFDYDAAACSTRIYCRLPIPPGAGTDFLTWCLSTNVLYWDVKFGLDAEGMLVAHADVDLDPMNYEATTEALLCRIDALGELIDEDLVGFIQQHGLATPAQRRRWDSQG